MFAESTFNDQWGTGLDKVGTENTKRSEWPGQNSLGQIIGKVAHKMRKRKKKRPMKSTQAKFKATKETKHDSKKHR